MTTILSYPPLPEQTEKQLLELIQVVFPDIDMDDVWWRLQNMPNLTCWCVYDDGKMVAFKIGYAIQIHRYYSWLGGVHPDWQRQGLAKQLMECQHKWLYENAFESVETCIRGHNEAMRQLNLASGFEEVGKRQKSYGYEFTFQKTL